MKVALHAGQLLQPVPGGIGCYVRSLLAHLPDVGIEPVAFGAGARPEDVPEGVEWVDLGPPRRGWLRYEAWHRLRRPRPRVAGDVLHAPSLAVPPPGARPLVVTIHDVAFLRHPHETTRRGRAFHQSGMNIARREADVVITPSHFTRTELLVEDFDPDRICVAPLGVDPPGKRPDVEIDALVAAAGLEAPYVLTVGTVEPRKGLPVLAEAVTAIRHRRPDITLAVVGPRGWGEIRGLERPGVRRVGRVDKDTLDALYRRAAVTCLASTYEGFGLPALEALTRASPLVATDGTALAEVVGDAGILVPPDDPEVLADALVRVLDDDALRADLARRGPVRAATFTWGRCVREHARAYALAVEHFSGRGGTSAPHP